MTKSVILRAHLSHELQSAAQTELVNTNTKFTMKTLYKDAARAFQALETLLGEDEWFFGRTYPDFLDAAVFAFVHLILDGGLVAEGNSWRDEGLRSVLEGCRGLTEHRERIRSRYFTPGE